jgi:hypothetical protein
VRTGQIHNDGTSYTGRVFSETKYDSRCLAVECGSQFVDGNAPSGGWTTSRRRSRPRR